MSGYHVGGRSLMWGRQSYRFSQLDFEANAKDGIAIDWPVRYNELAPWYDYVEQFIGVSGQVENLPNLPDGKFLPPMELNCVELELKKAVKEKLGRLITIGRTATCYSCHFLIALNVVLVNIETCAPEVALMAVILAATHPRFRLRKKQAT